MAQVLVRRLLRPAGGPAAGNLTRAALGQLFGAVLLKVATPSLLLLGM